MGGERQATSALPLGKRFGIHYIGGSMGPESFFSTVIGTPGLQTRSKSLYRLCPGLTLKVVGPFKIVTIIILMHKMSVFV